MLRTGGFLAIAYEHIARKLGSSAASTDIDTLKHDTFFGREKENLVFPIALANLVLHGIDQPNLWHGNSLTRRASYGALFDKAPKQFDVVLANPPFGGKEGKDAQKNFAFETSSTQVLFVQDILAELAPGGTCAIVLDEGLLFAPTRAPSWRPNVSWWTNATSGPSSVCRAEYSLLPAPV